MTPTSISLSGLRIDRVDRGEALDAIARCVHTGRGGYVVTPNLDHVALARGDATLRAAYAGAALSLADGRPLLWWARLAGTPLPAQVTGSDLLVPLLSRAQAEGWRVFVLGAREAVSRAARARMADEFPRLRVVGADTSVWQPHGNIAPEAEPTVQAVRRAGAQLVLVMYGCPKQEQWMHRHAPLLDGAVAVGLGGSLDFYAGAVKRAPRWMTCSGLEWMYRLAQEPRRLAHRYLWRDPLVVPPLVLEAIGHRLVALGGGVSFRDVPRPTRPAMRPSASLACVRRSA